MCDARIVAIAKQIVETKIDGAHFRAVQAQVAFSSAIFDGMIHECSNENGLAAEVLLRTLLESVTGTIILAKHPEKLEQFLCHARFAELGIMRSVSDPKLKPIVEESITKTQAEFEALSKEFSQESWHGFRTRDAFIQAEFPPHFYDSYYRRASAIAHAQPYATVRHGKVGAPVIAWKNYAHTAPVSARLLMAMLLKILDREFKLSLSNRISALDGEIWSSTEKSKQAILKAVSSQAAESGAQKAPLAEPIQ